MGGKSSIRYFAPGLMNSLCFIFETIKQIVEQNYQFFFRYFIPDKPL